MSPICQDKSEGERKEDKTDLVKAMWRQQKGEVTSERMPAASRNWKRGDSSPHFWMHPDLDFGPVSNRTPESC